jgi:hypothetical protein
MTDACVSFEEQPMRIWNSYIPGACPPSNSYGVEVQFPGTMKWTAHTPSPAQDLVAPWSPAADSQAPSEVPRAGAVLFEIGVLLGIHLAVALAVTLILRASGIV